MNNNNATLNSATRSFKKGQVSLQELEALADTIHVDSKRKYFKKLLTSVDAFALDALFVDGDLHIEGDLHLAKSGAFLLMVKGNLTVTGNWQDSDDPECFVFVMGSMAARNVVTAGWLEVHGDLNVEKHLLGDSNDCSAFVGGNVTTNVFFPEEHHFDVKGAFTAKLAFGIPSRLACTNPPAFVADEQLLDVIDHSLLVLGEDEDDDGNPVAFVDYIESAAVKKHVLAGRDVKPS